MHPRRLRKYAIGAGGMLVLVVAMLLASGWGSAVAAQISTVFVSNDAAHAVPVREQALDANGNLKVHEQGTASVNVGNAFVPVRSDESTDIVAGGVISANAPLYPFDVSGYKESGSPLVTAIAPRAK